MVAERGLLTARPAVHTGLCVTGLSKPHKASKTSACPVCLVDYGWTRRRVLRSELDTHVTTYLGGGTGSRAHHTGPKHPD